MALIHEDTDSEKRACILATAERLFREIGYLKTTVGDIAKTLKMSPANVYRFFDSKKAIHEGVARRLMGEDFWSYGLEANRHVLEVFLRRHHAEGLSSRLLAPEELFHPSTHETHRV